MTNIIPKTIAEFNTDSNLTSPLTSRRGSFIDPKEASAIKKRVSGLASQHENGGLIRFSSSISPTSGTTTRKKTKGTNLKAKSLLTRACNLLARYAALFIRSHLSIFR